MGWLGRMLRGGISEKANRVCDWRRMRLMMNTKRQDCFEAIETRTQQPSSS